jgi:hypothetical protein
MVIYALPCQGFLGLGSDNVTIVCPGPCTGTSSRAHPAETGFRHHPGRGHQIWSCRRIEGGRGFCLAGQVIAIGISISGAEPNEEISSAGPYNVVFLVFTSVLVEVVGNCGIIMYVKSIHFWLYPSQCDWRSSARDLTWRRRSVPQYSWAESWVGAAIPVHLFVLLTANC